MFCIILIIKTTTANADSEDMQMTQLTLEDQNIIEAELLGCIRTDSESEIVIYQHQEKLYQALNDETSAYPLDNDTFIDLAVEFLQHTTIENEALYRAVFQACITDQKNVGKNFPYFALNNNLPSHAQYALFVVNNYGFCPKGAINPIYHCIEATETVELDFGYLHMTNDEKNIVITRINNETLWNEVADILVYETPVNNLRTLENHSNKQEIIDAIRKMNTDADIWI